MSLKELGSFEETICDRVYTFAPTFEGLIKIEEISGQTVTVLVNKIMNGQLGARDITAILYGALYGAEQGKPGITYQQFGNQCMLHGLSKLLTACQIILGSGFTGKPVSEIDGSKEDKKKSEGGPNQ